MLFSDEGQQLGLLSGGCIPSDLLLNARKVIELRKSRRIWYDASDEDNIAWRLGIGCGGAAEILLHPCNEQNNYLLLDQIHTLLSVHKACEYHLHLITPTATLAPCQRDFSQRHPGKAQKEVLSCLINPLPHLLILGSGIDMIPLCTLALDLGWKVTLADPRLKAHQRSRFPNRVNLLSISIERLDDQFLSQVDAVVVAHHSLLLDSHAIANLQIRTSNISYVGLLGPHARKARVLEMAKVSEEQLRYPIAGPMGLALGGELPESIALAVLAECHGRLFGGSALPLSHSTAATFVSPKQYVSS